PSDQPSVAPKAAPGLRVAGLFAGIGGIELGLRRAGHETSLFCEIDGPASAVLRAQFPDVPLHDDVTTLKTLPKGVTLLTAGFPCQALRQAGQAAGVCGLEEVGEAGCAAGRRSGLVGQCFRLFEFRPVDWFLL